MPAPKLLLEPGAFYVDAAGHIVGPMRKDNRNDTFVGMWRGVKPVDCKYSEAGQLLNANGSHLVKRYVATLRPGASYRTERFGVETATAVSKEDGDWHDCIRLRDDGKFTPCSIAAHSCIDKGSNFAKYPGDRVFSVDGRSAADTIITHEVLSDGTEIPLPATWEEHDAYVAGLEAPKRAIELVAADVPGKYRISYLKFRDEKDLCGDLAVETTDIREGSWDGALLEIRVDGVWRTLDTLEKNGVTILCRVLPNGTEVGIGKPLCDLEIAMKKDAAKVPKEAPVSLEEIERFQSFNEKLKARRESNRLTSMDIACGFIPEHWKKAK